MFSVFSFRSLKSDALMFSVSFRLLREMLLKHHDHRQGTWGRDRWGSEILH